MLNAIPLIIYLQYNNHAVHVHHWLILMLYQVLPKAVKHYDNEQPYSEIMVCGYSYIFTVFAEW